MCGPIAAGILTFAVSAAQSVAQYSAQKEDAKNQREAARVAYEDDQRQTSLREMQEQDAASQKVASDKLQGAEIAAEASVQAAEGGVAGISVDNLMADISRRGARNRETISENTRMTIAQLQQQKKGSKSNAQSRINAAPNPSALGLVAGLAGAGLSGYNAYSKYMT